jgi:undecaprenyl-diphosphatase
VPHRKPFPTLRVACLALLAALFAATALGLDSAAVAWFAKDKTRSAGDFANGVSHWGDWEPVAVALIATFLIATAVRSRQVARTAMVALLAASCAGLTASALRVVTGRARPSAKVAAGWYGPHFGSHKLCSFPSAHTTVIAGGAAALAVLVPSAALPGALLVALMAWARMRLGVHHLSDVAAGALLGSFIGAWLVPRVPKAWPPEAWYAPPKGGAPASGLSTAQPTE